MTSTSVYLYHLDIILLIGVGENFTCQFTAFSYIRMRNVLKKSDYVTFLQNFSEKNQWEKQIMLTCDKNFVFITEILFLSLLFFTEILQKSH